MPINKKNYQNIKNNIKLFDAYNNKIAYHGVGRVYDKIARDDFKRMYDDISAELNDPQLDIYAPPLPNIGNLTYSPNQKLTYNTRDLIIDYAHRLILYVNGLLEIYEMKQQNNMQSDENDIVKQNNDFSEGFINQKTYDVFISYASEDKSPFVENLVEELCKKNLKTWYDVKDLDWGDNIFESIEYGLANCHYGIVVLSQFFLNKKWPKSELAGLMTRQMNGHNVILPIWHNLDESQFKKEYPMLASIVALNSKIHTIPYIASEVYKKIKNFKIEN